MEVPIYTGMSAPLERGYIYLRPLLPTAFKWLYDSMKLLKSFTTVLSCSVVASNAVPYSEYILAPTTRTLFPTSVYNVNGTVTGAGSLTRGNGSAIFQGVSSVTFGKISFSFVFPF